MHGKGATLQSPYCFVFERSASLSRDTPFAMGFSALGGQPSVDHVVEPDLAKSPTRTAKYVAETLPDLDTLRFILSSF